MPLKALGEFLKMEAAGGIVLVLAAAAALVVANSALAPLYDSFLTIPVRVGIGDFEIAKPLLLWINDGLMAIFFFLVGLEIKREFVKGELSSREQAILPAIGALGGMALPAAIYVLVNLGHPESLAGWAIPAATDIAFALGVLALLGSRAPFALKVLLTAIAVLDDLGAIVIIALFYTSDLSVQALGLAGGALAVLIVMNLVGVRRLTPYVVVGLVLWTCVLKSGVHATLAGVAVAMTVPIAEKDGHSLLEECEHNLHSWVAFGVLPLFGFANAGVSFAGISPSSLLEPLTLGIALGLFLGKQAGVFAAIRLSVRFGLARLPAGVSWLQIWGLAVLCGIGFTMSLFIGGLAWEHSHFDAPLRLGVLGGSILSAALGAVILSVAAVRGRARRRSVGEGADPAEL